MPYLQKNKRKGACKYGCISLRRAELSTERCRKLGNIVLDAFRKRSRTLGKARLRNVACNAGVSGMTRETVRLRSPGS